MQINHFIVIKHQKFQIPYIWLQNSGCQTFWNFIFCLRWSWGSMEISLKVKQWKAMLWLERSRSDLWALKLFLAYLQFSSNSGDGLWFNSLLVYISCQYSVCDLDPSLLQNWFERSTHEPWALKLVLKQVCFKHFLVISKERWCLSNVSVVY
jgi:hypothetical protein